MKFTRFFSLVFLFVFSKNLLAQTQNLTGWQLIEQNNFVAARPVFEADLKKNPSDEAALVGLMFLSETVHDYENYKKFANQLMVSNWKSGHFWLFGHLFDGTPEQVLAHPMPPEIRTQLLLNQADSLFVHRKFEESAIAFRKVIPDWQWLLTGPFSDVGGSGFLDKNLPETAPFSKAQIFKNEEGTEFGWLERRMFPPGSFVDFGRLPEQRGMSTFFAQTFLENATERTVQLRLTRHEPVKIWLDDQILLDRPRQTAKITDLESATFVLPKGTHRLLVKLSEFPDDDPETKISLAFNDVLDDSPDSDFRQRYGRSQGNGRFRRQNETEFLIRFCDPATGETLQDLTSNFEGKYQPADSKWQVELFENMFLAAQIDQKTSNYLSNYLLAKAFAISEKYETGEEYFSNQLKINPSPAFLKFLLAKFYAADDKDDRAEGLLSELDTVRCPTLAANFLRLEKINVEQNETEYLGQLEKMLSLSPTNFPLISTYLNKLKSKGKKEQVKGFVRQFLEKNKDKKWKERLEEYLEDDSYKPESYKATTDKDRQKQFKLAQKRLKTRFSFTDYSTLIEFYKTKNKPSEVLKIHDELIKIMPWNTNRKIQKAKFLFEKEKYDEALAIYQNLLPHLPYSTDILETMGDIFIEKKDETEALKWYRRAEKLADGRGSLDRKIEKLENSKKFNGYFETVSLEEAAKNKAWEEKYRGEESVISLFSQQLTYKKDEDKIEAVRKMVIHILNDAGAKSWTEADFRGIGRISSAKVLKKDGSVTSPSLDYRTAVFKNLQAGDIILVEGYAEQGMKDEVPGEFLAFEVLSWPAPVAVSTMEMLVPKDLKLFFSSNRIAAEPTLTRDTGDLKMLKWVWKNVEKLEREEASPGNLDVYSWLMVGNAPDWTKIVKWYNQKTYCRTAPNYEVLEKARQLVRPGMSETEIVETLHTFITGEINYSFVPFLNTSYVPKKPGATLAGKVGDCKDVATLMISLLRENGIQAWFTLAETHSFSRREPRPAIYCFNHAIVAYQLSDGKLRFADLTTDYYPNGIVPEFDSDAWGLVIRDGENQLVRLPNHALDPEKSRVEITGKATVDADENLILDVSTVNFGCPAGRWREELIPAAPEDRRKLMSEYFGGGVLTHLDFEELTFENLEKINEPLRMKLRLKSFNQLDRVSNFWIMPLPLPLATPTHRALFAGTRYNQLDVDDLFELAPVRETVDLTLPDGFTFLEMPKNVHLSGEFGEYILTFEPLPGGVRIKREVTFRQRYIEPKDFAAFKKFYVEMLDADDTKVAVRKK